MQALLLCLVIAGVWPVAETDQTPAVDETRDYGETVIPLPRSSGDLVRDDCYLLARIHTLHDDHPCWNRRIGVYLQPTGSRWWASSRSPIRP